MYPNWFFNDLFGKYKRRSLQTNVQFTLTLEEFSKLILMNCVYCKCTPGNSNKGIKYNGIDRKDPHLGYVTENVVPCCRKCNMVKNNVLSFEEMLLVMSFVLKLREMRSNG